MSNPLLEVKDLTVTYLTTPVLRNLSFSIQEGERLGVVGESGSGKSSLARALLNLTSPGSIPHISGEILHHSKERGAMIFQDSMTSLNPTMKVGRQVLEAVFVKHPKISPSQGKKEVYALFQNVGFSSPESLYHYYPHELSGGMRQRVMIAMALALEPKLLVADEATSSLDVTIQAQILDLLKEIQRHLGMAILFITHDLPLACSFCDRILVLYQGMLVESATPEELLHAPSHPYTKKLLSTLLLEKEEA